VFSRALLRNNLHTNKSSPHQQSQRVVITVGSVGRVLLKDGTLCSRPGGAGKEKEFSQNLECVSEVSRKRQFQKESQALVSHVKDIVGLGDEVYPKANGKSLNTRHHKRDMISFVFEKIVLAAICHH
jgi:hypothetical protein